MNWSSSSHIEVQNRIYTGSPKITMGPPLALVYSLIIIMFLLTRCSDTQSPEAATPTNLLVKITNPNDGSGILRLDATADDATGYEFYFEAEGSEDPIYSVEWATLDLIFSI